MAKELVFYIVVDIFGALLSLFLGIYAVLKIRNTPGGKHYIIATLLSSLFTLFYVFELTSSSLEEIKMWIRMEYLPLSFLPVFILLMCFEFVGAKIKTGFYYVLFGLPMLTIFLQFTNDYHHIYYTSMKLKENSPFPVADLTGGPWFYIHSIFLYACVVISIVILLKHVKMVHFKFKMQLILMSLGLFAPIIGSIFYLSGTSPYSIDTGPISMSLSFLFHGAALFSFRMFNVAPIFRDIVFESMKEGVIVLNEERKVVDYNHVAKKIVPTLKSKMIGYRLDEILEKNSLLLEIIQQEKEQDYKWSIDQKTGHYHISYSPVYNKMDKLIGKVITFSDVTERVEMQEKLQKLASIDGLTQVYNRTFFLKETERLIESLSIEGAEIACIMFDIDHFKQINDTHGHEAGDTILKHVVNMAQSSLNEEDLIGRFGGEEFIIFMPNSSLQDAYKLAEETRKKIFESNKLVNGKKITVTSSFGISNTITKFGKNRPSFEELMNQADQALYTAKRTGRNCVCLFADMLQKT
ncbi:histidine kinase N-terminal 7TM domain-containing protein [Niallia sp. NCCP-28]|uniref:histidine kinase N-terminal 7TM domain-containing diguanylate cyclase n=1 Tax=Niallia sp. NCCP-28 TaxID=2934712 RepID=UPI00208D881E|nr:histidine kinase N-terminal 7TM domain-containing protein [Niallia sp. NCCP-28]GKU82163.1 GGDEF domain-containing protein [Niallia sp. NCCP-28]